ncbi:MULTISPECIES: hypothetical protein [Sphingobium]|uniref:hypothetical protein n=1 Tax=Sphingobium TaxID=165695 RepID=UPI0015EC2789|nr:MULTISPECIES: hypothetical protein [Sphingobium]MCW2348742.1 hypothetical protein [Sphingobium sp. B12D2B]MCW2363604.1 hypothetical protein [Sphingobium sp. B10D3B]MCW2367869.1 hypothetical protein [Sphingobium sp. B11D3D]MCW2402998.1 hypothetical protein [Sphingobium sp. B10D7B]MCW2409976.1 hypothetical protein [Sphingobium xanthum]
MSSKFHLIAAAAAIAILPLAQPALAAPAAETTYQIPAKVLKRGDQTFYCFKQQATTGTRMSRRVCVTEKELSYAGARIEGAGDSVQISKGGETRIASQR